MSLFYVESRGAGEMGRPPGHWQPCGEADTLAEAVRIRSEEDAKGWRDVRITANHEAAEALRAAAVHLLRSSVSFHQDPSAANEVRCYQVTAALAALVSTSAKPGGGDGSSA